MFSTCSCFAYCVTVRRVTGHGHQRQHNLVAKSLNNLLLVTLRTKKCAFYARLVFASLLLAVRTSVPLRGPKVAQRRGTEGAHRRLLCVLLGLLLCTYHSK